MISETFNLIQLKLDRRSNRMTFFITDERNHSHYEGKTVNKVVKSL